MTQATVAKLNTLNRQFYASIHEDFNRTRQAPWPGWVRIQPFIAQLSEPFTVLDIGCGNGRFGRFLTNKQYQFDYEGIDNNESLLAAAKEYTTTVGDFLTTPIATIAKKYAYDLVVLFGVLHHVPGLETRKHLLHQAAALVQPGGLLVVSAWQFALDPRFLHKFHSFDTLGIDKADIEMGDYLLSWGETSALRYVHHVDEEEQSILIKAIGLTKVQLFEADGKTGKLNKYLVFKRIP